MFFVNKPEAQIGHMKQLLETKVLNSHQIQVIERLISATERGTEDLLAQYIDTMDSAAVHWALNNANFMRLL